MTDLRFSRNPILYGFRNPGKAVDYITLKRRFRDAFHVEVAEILRWQDELVHESGLPSELEMRWQRAKHTPLTAYSGGTTIGPMNEILYFIVRALKPSVVVETGVAAGFSSAYLLEGLRANGGGVLHSIDLPTLNPRGRVNRDGQVDEAHVDTVEETGFVIPDGLRKNWTLHLGASQTLLPPLLKDLGGIDLFWHDSDHSYESMIWEFRTAWASLREGGWLATDDITWNRAFRDFGKGVSARSFRWLGRGALQKRPRSALRHKQ